MYNFTTIPVARNVTSILFELFIESTVICRSIVVYNSIMPTLYPGLYLGSLRSPRWSSDVSSVFWRNDRGATNNPRVICLRSVYRGNSKAGQKKDKGVRVRSMAEVRGERVMKRIRLVQPQLRCIFKKSSVWGFGVVRRRETRNFASTGEFSI